MVPSIVGLVDMEVTADVTADTDVDVNVDDEVTCCGLSRIDVKSFIDAVDLSSPRVYPMEEVLILISFVF